jgi:hypothetical protein
MFTARLTESSQVLHSKTSERTRSHFCAYCLSTALDTPNAKDPTEHQNLGRVCNLFTNIFPFYNVSNCKTTL